MDIYYYEKGIYYYNLYKNTKNIVSKKMAIYYFKKIYGKLGLNFLIILADNQAQKLYYLNKLYN